MSIWPATPDWRSMLMTYPTNYKNKSKQSKKNNDAHNYRPAYTTPDRWLQYTEVPVIKSHKHTHRSNLKLIPHNEIVIKICEYVLIWAFVVSLDDPWMC